MRKFGAAAAAFLLAAAFAAGHAAADKSQPEANDTAELAGVLELLGHLEIDSIGGDLFAMMAERAVPVARRKVPDLPEDAYAIFHEELAAAFRAGMVELMSANARLYAEHLTPREVEELNAFYATDTGKKTLKVLPMLMQQSVYMGQEWVARLQRDAERSWAERLKQEGYLK